MVGDGSADPPKPSIRNDHAVALARSASRAASLARCRHRRHSPLPPELGRPRSGLAFVIRSTPTTKQPAMMQARQMALTQDLILSQPDVPTVPDVTD
jgi:hypothetical protein